MALLRRVRLFVLVFACLATVPAFIALGRSTQPGVMRVGGVVAVLGLVGLWALAYRRQRLTWPTELFTAAALFTLVQGAGDARSTQGFFFATLMFNGLFGTTPQLVVRLLLIQAAFFSVEPLSHGALSTVGFMSAGIVVWALGRALEKQGSLEDELRAREARFRSLVTNASDMTIVLGLDGKISWQSPAVERQLGRSLALDEISDPASTLTLRGADGSLRECEATVTDLRADPSVKGVVLNVRDVTERNHAAQAMKKKDLELAETRHEIELASRIQQALLPKRFDVRAFEVAALMVPAEDVGGDYYDVLPSPDGFFLGVGDVSGHGLNSGLIMLMIQSVVSALVRERPSAGPRELVVTLNTVLHDNIQNRMGQNDHVTLTLLKLVADGTVTFAGAHEDLIIQRSGGGRAQTLETPGTWLGAVPDISRVTLESTLKLAVGDVLLLHTDGISEARNDKGEMFGLERMLERIDAMPRASPQELIDALRKDVMAWAPVRSDDATLLAVRYTG